MVDAVKADPAVQNSIFLLRNTMKDSRDNSCPAGVYSIITKAFDNDSRFSSAYMYGTIYFWLGSVGVSSNGSGSYKVDCCDGSFGAWSITITSSFSDTLDEIIPADDPGGWWGSLPVTSTGEWEDTFSGDE